MTSPQGSNALSALFWDMAGTLLPFDPTTGRPGILPGCDDFLPELARNFRLFVTTGDTTGGARELLSDHGILRHFEAIYGDLFGPVGKPYGSILRQVGADPRRSLAIGDRLRSDVPGDTGDLLTVLINQDGNVVNAGMIAFLIGRLRRHAETFPAAFDIMLAGSETDTDIAADQGVVRATKLTDGFLMRLWLYRHPALTEDRRVIVI
jgi:hypothetical protein